MLAIAKKLWQMASAMARTASYYPNAPVSVVISDSVSIQGLIFLIITYIVTVLANVTSGLILR